MHTLYCKYICLCRPTYHHTPPKKYNPFYSVVLLYKISIDRLYNAGNKPCYAHKHNHTARDNKYYYDFEKKSKLKKFALFIGVVAWYLVLEIERKMNCVHSAIYLPTRV